MKSFIWPGLAPADTPLPSHCWKNCATAESVMAFASIVVAECALFVEVEDRRTQGVGGLGISRIGCP